jgi:hypothetical protein
MAARLPTVGGDDGNWGQILNDFLSQSHNADGSIRSTAAVTSVVGQTGIITGTQIAADGALTSTYGPVAGSDSWLKTWANNVIENAVTIIRNADGVPASASVKWPNGITGTFTATLINTLYQAVDAYTLTYDDTPVKVITQSAVTRDSSGAVVMQPDRSVA